MNKKKLWWMIPGLLILIAAIWMGTFYLILRHQSQQSRPLVLIQNPVDQERIIVGKNTTIHTVASLDQGIKSMQLWVDDVLIAERKAAGDELNSLMTISAPWMPQLVGEHTIIVRAVSINGVYGQSTINVEGVDPSTGQPVIHEVEDGETLEEIAASYDVGVDEILQANSEMDGGQPQGGDDLVIPAAGGGYTPEFDSWAGESEDGREAPPPPAPPAPGSLQMMDIVWPLLAIQPTTPVQLQVEVSALQTRESYEFLHCYVSLAGSPPVWLPDADNNQSTDESFETRGDGTLWNVARYLAETNATRIAWEENTPVPLDISCVGITENGRESVDLGRIMDEVPPDQWGVAQTRRSSGGESQFNLAFLVTYPEKGPDTSILPPYNVRLHDNNSTLSWSYDDDVDGFAIFLNDQLQFTVDGSRREAAIPPQWFDVPCNTTFDFSMVAFNESYPDGPYSDTSDSVTLSGAEPGDLECPLSIILTFQTLTTGNLGNPVPVSGHFMAQDQRISFDGRVGSGDQPNVGLTDNSAYNIADLVESSGVVFNSLHLVLPYDDPENPYDSLQVGFEIYDESNRLACGGDLAVSAEDLTEDFVGTIHNEYPVENDPALCVVTFGIFPIIEGASDNPLPDLNVEEITYDFERDFYRVFVRNTGQADWVNHDLVMDVRDRQGGTIGRYTFPNITIGVNEMREFQNPAWNWEPILDGCVMLDPDNQVQERIDVLAEQNILSRGFYCQPLPDFTISDVEFDRATNYLGVTIRNEGDKTPKDTELVVRVETESGAMYDKTVKVTLERYESTREWLELSNDEREAMAGGYTVTVNPDEVVAETEYGNNSFSVEGSTLLRLSWRQSGAWFCSLYRQWWGNYNNHWKFNFGATVVGGSDPQNIVNWEYEDLEINVDDHLSAWCSTNYMTDWFAVGGDEELVVSMSATMSMAAYRDRHSNGGSEHLSASDGFGGVTVIPMDMDAALYGHTVYTNDVSHAESCGVSTAPIGQADPYDWEAGMHRWGPFYVEDTYGSGHEDLDPCYWSSTYMLYQAEEP